jgi:hypothetical protein
MRRDRRAGCSARVERVPGGCSSKAALWTCCLACALLAPGLCRAQAARAEPSYALSWVRGEGAEQCPSGRDLTREVEARVGRAVFDAAAERSVEVQVSRENDSYHSNVYVRAADGQTIGRRALESNEASCAPIFQATVLAVALVIDPEAEPRKDHPKAVATFAPVTSSIPAVPPVPTPAARVAVTKAPSVRPSPSPTPIQSPAHALSTLSVRGVLSSSLVPGTSPGLALDFSIRPGKDWGFSAGALYLSPAIASRDTGRVQIGLSAATLGATFDAARLDHVRLMLEADAWGGALQTAVLSPTPTAPGPFPFLAVELGARAQIALSRGVFAEIGGGLAVPLLRRGLFVAGAAEPIWREPALAGLGFFGLGASFP